MPEKLDVAVNPACPLCPALLLRLRALQLPHRAIYVVGSAGTWEEAAYQVVVRECWPERFADYVAARWGDYLDPMRTAENLGLDSVQVKAFLPVAKQMVLEETAWWEFQGHGEGLPAVWDGERCYKGADCLDDYLEAYDG